MLSDSIAISLTVFLVAAWIAVYRAPTPWTVAGVLVATTLWTFARELHVYVTAVIALVVVVGTIVRRARALWWVVAAGLVVIGTVGVLDRRSNDETAKENLAGVIGARVLPDHETRQWFVDAGMPAMTELAEGRRIPTRNCSPSLSSWSGPGSAVGSCTPASWSRIRRRRSMVRCENCSKSARPSPRIRPGVPCCCRRPSLRALTPGLPPVVEDVLFDPGRTGALLTLALITLTTWLMVSARHGADRRSHVPLLVVGASLVYVAAAWHGSVFEPGRHAMPAAIAIRVGLIALLAVTADAALGGSDRSDFDDAR